MTRMGSKLRWLLLAALCSATEGQAADQALLPEGGRITSGSGAITRSGNTVTVTQNSDRLITQWQRFDIGDGARVDFLQPDADSVALNRVLGGNASQILGTLHANGRVYLINPAGVVFGDTAQVDVGGLVASSLGLSDADFIAGRDDFANGGGAGAVINRGVLNGRVVALIAPQVRNEGTITARTGTAALAAGDAVSLDFAGDGLLRVSVDRAAFRALAENKGLIRADGGAVVMTARAAGDLMSTVINNDGIIEAQGLVERNGQILLDGGGEGITRTAGTLDASSAGRGGRIAVTGDKVLVDEGARLDARGGGGGGAILIGGGWQGSDATLRPAHAAVVRPGAVLDASAGDRGNGGTVVVWSDVHDPDSLTRAEGQLIARGGQAGGDGGRIETSGHHLDVTGIGIDAAAPQGRPGQWLIDPSDITVTTAGSGSLSGGVFDPGGASDTISPATILAGLASADVTLQTSGGSGGNGDITVANAIVTTGDLGATRTLSLRADRDIIFNANTGIDATASGNAQRLNIVLNSDTDADGVGGITLVSGVTLASNGGTIALGGGTAGTASGFTGGLSQVAAYALPSGTAGNVGIAIGGGSTLDAGGGNLVLNGQGKAIDATGRAKGIELVPDDTAGSVRLQTTGSGSITLDGKGDAAAGGDFNYGVDFNNAAGSINGITISAQNGAVAISGTGGGTGTSASNDGILFEGDNTTITAAAGGIGLSGVAGSTSGKAITVGGNTTLGGGATTGNLTLTGDSIGLTGGTLQTTGTLTFNATAATTVSEAASTVIAADKLLLAGAGATYNFAGGSNAVNTLAANAGGVSYVDGDALTIGTVGASNGISATAPVSVATQSGDLTLAKNVTTSDAGSAAVVLNAGLGASAGTAAGGNLIVSGGATVTTGAGGRATLYSGSVSASTGLTSLIGSGTGLFRYDSDETAANYSAALGSGRYAVYREQPTVTVSADNQILVYGTAPTLSDTITGLQNGDTTAQAFSTAPSVTAGGATSTSGNYIAGSHTLSAGGAVDSLGYAIAYSNGTLTVNAKTLAVTYTGTSRVYDGTAAATVTTSDDRAAGDVFTVAHSETFADKNVGTGKTITVSGVSLSGADAANYTVAPAATATANITARPLTVAYTGLNKVYDGTTLAVVTTADDRIAGDSLSINRTAAFSDKNVGTGKAVSLTGVSLTGTDAANYSVSATGSTTANITPRALNVIYTGVDRAYDGTTLATVTTSDDRVTGDGLTINRSAAFAPDPNVGTGKTVNVTGVSLSGIDAGNYSVTATGSTTANITPKALTLAATAADKVYDGGVSATVTGYGLSGFVGSETVTAGSTGAAFADKNAGSGKTVSISGITLSDGTNGGLASNYSVSGTATATAAITPRTLNVAYTGVNKVYDGTVTATVTTADDRVAGDDLGIDRTAAFADKNVGTGKSVSVSGVSLTGTDAGNYTVTATGATSADISQRDLTAVYTASDKVYDGDAVAAVVGSSTDVVTGDNVSFSQSAFFSDRNAATGKTVSVSGITLGGADAANYNLLNSTATASADITPKPLSISALVADKVYDGSTAATVKDFVLGGFVGSETVTAAAAGAAFDTRLVGADKTVTLTGVTLSDGTNGGLAANYMVPATLTATANITPNPYVTNVTSSLTSPATGINGTGLGAGTAIQDGAAAAPGSGGETVAAVAGGLFEFGRARGGATSGLTLNAGGRAGPVSFATVGGTMTLFLGFADANLRWPLTASLPVYTSVHGGLQPQTGYNVVDNGSSLALSEGFAAAVPPRSGNRAGASVVLSLALRREVAAEMTVQFDRNGSLRIAVDRGSLLTQDLRTVVLLGLAAAKERLGISLYDIKAVVVEKRLEIKGRS